MVKTSSGSKKGWLFLILIAAGLFTLVGRMNSEVLVFEQTETSFKQPTRKFFYQTLRVNYTPPEFLIEEEEKEDDKESDFIKSIRVIVSLKYPTHAPSDFNLCANIEISQLAYCFSDNSPPLLS